MEELVKGNGLTKIFNLINPTLKNIPEDFVPAFKNYFGNSCDTLTCASLWHSLFRTDYRPVMEKITTPLLYLMPELPLYSMTTVEFIKNHIKGKFVLAKDFPNTTHQILMEKPNETAESVKIFLGE